MEFGSDPQRSPSKQDPPADRGRNETSLFAGSVLVVDDNEVNQQIAMGALEKLGYRCDTASNGRQAISALARNRYDIVLMDCQMPEMDGYEATRRIRAGDAGATYTAIPIVALTSDNGSDARERCEEAGMNDYLSKPFDVECLSDLLNHLLPKARRK